jgi:two-component system sensor histidine kinase KdpD
MQRIAAWLSHRHWLVGLVVGVVLIAVVTVAVHLFRPYVPVLALGVLYIWAVLPVAIWWGRWPAALVAVASVLALNWFFLPPVHTFTLADRENWYALAVYLVVAVVVADLATRARQRAREAEQREREAAVLADLSTAFLSGRSVEALLPQVAERAAEVLGLQAARIELAAAHEPLAGESPLALGAGDRTVGTLYAREGAESSLAARRRFLPALASLLAVALDRERFGREAVEAEALRTSDSIKTAVLRAVSHDLRTPLTAMRVAVDALATPELSFSGPERDEFMATLRDALGRLERLVGDLLDLSRLQAGVAVPNAEVWPLDELVARALAALGSAADRVVVSIPDELPPVRVDAAQLERVFANVLENALRVSPAGTSVTVRATATRRDLIVRIVDHGPGLPQGADARIFEPFESEETERGRAGLGLAIARGFAEANGCTISVESHPGQGATFTVSIPHVPVPFEIPA